MILENKDLKKKFLLKVFLHIKMHLIKNLSQML